MLQRGEKKSQIKRKAQMKKIIGKSWKTEKVQQPHL